MTHTHFFSAVTIFVALAVLIVSAEGAGDAPVPPVAKAIPHDTTLHGERRRDDYFWLRDKTNPEVIRYLEAENQYTAAVMKHTEALQQQLYKEILGRIKETDLSVPERIGDYYYYNRTQEGQQYPIYCRKKGSLKAEEEVLLDENRLADGRKYMRIGAFRVSPDHKLLAYSTDTDGSESYTLHVKDLASDKLLPDLVPGTYYGLEWAADNRTLFYTKFDSARRPYQLFRHRLGADPAQDALLYQENDERFFLEIERTRSRQYLILSADSKTSSEVRYLRTDQPDAEFKLVAARRPEIEYDVEHHGDKFFITTNENAKNFKLMEAPVSDPSTRNWKEVIPHRASVKLDGVHAFENYLVISERDRGLRSLRVKDLKTGQIRPVDFPEPV